MSLETSCCNTAEATLLFASINIQLGKEREKTAHSITENSITNTINFPFTPGSGLRVCVALHNVLKEQ